MSLVGAVGSCLRLARSDGSPRTRHGAGIYQATEPRNLDKSDMCGHASASVWCLCLFLRLCTLSLFSRRHISDSISMHQKQPRSTREPGRMESRSETSWPTVQLYVQPQFRLWQEAVTGSYAAAFFLWISSFMFSIKSGLSITASLIMILLHFNQ